MVKKGNNNPTLLNALLLALLIASASGIFFTLPRAHGDQSIPYLSILFLAISILLGFALFFANINTLKQQTALESQIESLKKHLALSRNGKNNQQETNAKSQTTADPRTFAQELMPANEYASIDEYLEALLQNIGKKMDVVQGVVFLKEQGGDQYTIKAGYAFYTQDSPPTFVEGETLPGQVAKNKETLIVTDIPEGYITILSGLGSSSPKQLLIAPIVSESGNCLGIIELAAFKPFESQHLGIFSALGTLTGEKVGSWNSNSQE